MLASKDFPCPLSGAGRLKLVYAWCAQPQLPPKVVPPPRWWQRGHTQVILKHSFCKRPSKNNEVEEECKVRRWFCMEEKSLGGSLGKRDRERLCRRPLDSRRWLSNFRLQRKNDSRRLNWLPRRSYKLVSLQAAQLHLSYFKAIPGGQRGERHGEPPTASLLLKSTVAFSQVILFSTSSSRDKISFR